MKLRPSFAILVTTVALAACQPPAAEWTENEAPKQIGLGTAPSVIELRFAAGSERLLPADATRLRALAAGGAIAPSDRVIVSGGGAPRLAEARAAAVSAELLHYGIVTNGAQLETVPADRVVVAVDRTLVTLPRCPNWSKPPATDFTNSLGSYYGCSSAVNLGRMVAYPTDLASGQPQGMPSGIPATLAMQRYLTDKVMLPAATTVGPIAAAASAPPGNSGGGGPGGSQ